MSLWILDTDHISLWQTDDPAIRRRLAQIDPQDFAVTIVSFEEQMRGRLNEIHRASSDGALVDGYRHLQMTEEFFGALRILAYSREAQALFRQLRQQRVRIGTRDLRIAAIGLSVDGTVVTRNQRDFRQVPGLRLADWTLADPVE
jgi:tRNA(fMet)-specific endonuclease VapC